MVIFLSFPPLRHIQKPQAFQNPGVNIITRNPNPHQNFSDLNFSMFRASIKAIQAGDQGSAACTVDFNGGDVKLRASVTDATFIAGTSFKGVSFGVEKPGAFAIDYDVPGNDVKFQFMNTVRVADKPLNLVYTHMKGAKRTALDGTLVIGSGNKLSANYAIDTGNCKIKYSYVHRGRTTIEPSYDTGKNSWDFAVSQKILDRDVIKATYQTSNRELGLDWFSNSKYSGGFKISATLSLADEIKLPKLTAETTWNVDI